MTRFMFSILVIGFAQFSMAYAQAADEDITATPYCFQRLGSGSKGAISTEYELGYGTRDTRFVGEKGTDQRLRLRYQLTDYLNLEATGGLLLQTGHARSMASVEANIELLDDLEQGIGLDIGAAYLFDYRADHVLRFRTSLSKTFGIVQLVAAGILDLPLTGDRDELDLMVSLAGAISITPWFSQGLELAAEDLEGLWEPDEAEGGARFMAGPTAFFSLGHGISAKLNVSGIYTPVSEASSKSNRSTGLGILGRLILAYSF